MIVKILRKLIEDVIREFQKVFGICIKSSPEPRRKRYPRKSEKKAAAEFMMELIEKRRESEFKSKKRERELWNFSYTVTRDWQDSGS